MIWIIILLFCIIVLFSLSFIGLSYKKPKTSLIDLVSVGNNPVNCSQNKVKCFTPEECTTKCSDIIEMDCVKPDNNEITTYIYTFKITPDINNGSIRLDNPVDSIDKLTKFTISINDKNNKNVDFNSLILYNSNNFINTLYLNFKPEDTINFNNNFVSYNISKPYPLLSDKDISFNVQFKGSPNFFKVNNEIAIKWVNIRPINSQEGVCVPSQSTKIPDCNKKNGGMLVWTGWTNPDVMEWTCICQYPDFASGPTCETINPNVCKGGTFNWKDNQLPTDAECSCDKDNILVKDYRGVPYCIPKDEQRWYTNYFLPNGDII